MKLEVKYLKEVTPYFLKVVSRPHHLRNISMFTASLLVSILHGILFRQRCSQALAGRDLTPSLCLNRLPFLIIVDYLDILDTVDIVDVGSIDHCLLNEYYGDGTPWS